MTPGAGFGESGEEFFRAAMTVDETRLEEAVERMFRAKVAKCTRGKFDAVYVGRRVHVPAGRPEAALAAPNPAPAGSPPAPGPRPGRGAYRGTGAPAFNGG